jgi:hypothetical protein
VVVLQLLRDDRPDGWPRAELLRELDDVDPDAIRDAVASLAAAGVVILDGEHIQASPCARRLDALGLVTI